MDINSHYIYCGICFNDYIEAQQCNDHLLMTSCAHISCNSHFAKGKCLENEDIVLDTKTNMFKTIRHLGVPNFTNVLYAAIEISPQCSSMSPLHQS